jgi:hypothetical protein
MRLAWLWGVALLVVASLAANCGAMTLEPLPPDEPLPEAAPPPRLMRKDAGPSTSPESTEQDPR